MQPDPLPDPLPDLDADLEPDLEPESEPDLESLRFTAFFERRVADWCEERGATADALAGALRRCADRAEAKGDDDAEGALLLASLQAIFDFESFMVLMRETKRGASWDMASMFEQ